MPILSIITLVYNQAPFLEERIRSIREQNYQEFEWIIIDDCSTDNSAEVIKKLAKDIPQLKYFIVHERNHGVHPSFNEAVSLCSGKYVHHAAGDDSCSRFLFEKSIDFLENNPSLSFVHTAYRIIDNNGNVICINYPLKNSGIEPGLKFFKRSALRGHCICSPSVTFNKKYFHSVGGINNNYVYASDYELWMKLSLLGDIGYIFDPLVYWRRHSQALSQRSQITLEGCTESYRVLKNVFSMGSIERYVDDHEYILKKSLRNVSTHTMFFYAMWWLLYQRNPQMSYLILKEANKYDRGVWFSPLTPFLILKNYIPIIYRHFIKKAGGSSKYLPQNTK